MLWNRSCHACKGFYQFQKKVLTQTLGGPALSFLAGRLHRRNISLCAQRPGAAARVLHSSIPPSLLHAGPRLHRQPPGIPHHAGVHGADHEGGCASAAWPRNASQATGVPLIRHARCAAQYICVCQRPAETSKQLRRVCLGRGIGNAFVLLFGQTPE